MNTLVALDGVHVNRHPPSAARLRRVASDMPPPCTLAPTRGYCQRGHRPGLRGRRRALQPLGAQWAAAEEDNTQPDRQRCADALLASLQARPWRLGSCSTPSASPVVDDEEKEWRAAATLLTNAQPLPPALHRLALQCVPSPKGKGNNPLESYRFGEAYHRGLALLLVALRGNAAPGECAASASWRRVVRSALIAANPSSNQLDMSWGVSHQLHRTSSRGHCSPTPLTVRGFPAGVPTQCATPLTRPPPPPPPAAACRRC